VSLLALRDLMRVIGYSSATAWIFPAIIDTAVAVSTMMLVALGQTRTAYTGIRTGQSQCTYRIRTYFLTFETALSACGSDRTECRIRTCGPRTADRIR
jgi:hypothetical protein